MPMNCRYWVRPVLCAAASMGLAAGFLTGCGGLSDAAGLLGSSIIRQNQAGTGGTTDGGTVGGDGGFFGGGTGGTGPTNPCDETLSRKFVRISMRNLNPDDFVHYFVGFVAFVNSETYPEGAVCPDDADLYTSFGYQAIAENQQVAFGTYCIEGPALLYFHRNGQFRNAGTGAGAPLASAIGPAQGEGTAFFDNFFTSAGAQVPVPNLILWHNPGGASGGSLRVSRGDPQPCAGGEFIGTFNECEQDAFYYVDDNDLPSGSATLGIGSSRRVPSEIQGTGCECPSIITLTQGEQSLIPPTIAIRNRQCNTFARGGRIEYVFIRDDQTPPVPQLLWRVSDATGSVIQDFDSRVDVP